MTSAAIRAMKPGPELDAAIAEKVMGWPAYDYGFDVVFTLPDGNVKRLENWEPSTSIFNAFEVVEAMRKNGERFLSLSITDDDIEQWKCLYYDGMQRAYAFGETAPHAICLAALLAVEKETHDA